MASSPPHLTKSKVLAGRQCPKRLWLSRHEPELAAPLPATARAIRDMGNEIGRLAQHLFPGGVLVEEGPRDHAAAVRRTLALLLDDSVPAIFEAAFEFARVRIRVDVLERLPQGAWGLREVKAAARPKDLYVEDVALQQHVLAGCGLEVASVELIHVNPHFERGEGDVAWEDFFTRVDFGAVAAAGQGVLPERIAELLDVLAAADPPSVEPGLHCRTRRPCEFWESCTRDKASDWILRMPRLTRKQFDSLREASIERIPDIAPDFALHLPQRNMHTAFCSGEDFVAHGLAEALQETGPPAWYLDFETANPALPLYRGTRPFQNVPFQWSLHREDADGLHHRQFLAAGAGDPRRDFAESLLEALHGGSDPILVYSPFESRVLENLAATFPDLAGALQAICKRLIDLLPIVRNCVYHVGFGGSFSIKSVAPALAPGFDYGDLDGVAEGGAAAAAFREIASGALSPGDEAHLRAQLEAYCEHDTLALVHVHRALRAGKTSAAAC
jgi:hypothetical protein